MFRSYRSPVRSGPVTSDAPDTGRSPSRLASELLDLSGDGAFTLWRWYPDTGEVETFGRHSATSLDGWLEKTHADDADEVLAFLRDFTGSGSPTAVCEYRWRDARRGDWLLLRHSLRRSEDNKSRGGVIEGVLETVSYGTRSRSLLDVAEEDLREGETRMARFLEDAYRVFQQSDPLPLLQLLRAALRADTVALKTLERRSNSPGGITDTSDEHTVDLPALKSAVKEALSSPMDFDRETPVEIDLETAKGSILYFTVRPVRHSGGSVRGAVCAGYATAESRALAKRFDSLLTLTATLLSSRLGNEAWTRHCRDLLQEVKEARCRGTALTRANLAASEIESRLVLVDRSLSRLNAVSSNTAGEEFCEALSEARENLGAAAGGIEEFRASVKRHHQLQKSDLNRMVERTVSMLDGILLDSVSIFLDLDPRLEPVVCDEAAFREALLILILQAQEDSIEKGILSISTRLTPAKGDPSKNATGFWISHVSRGPGGCGETAPDDDPVHLLLAESGVQVVRHRDARDGVSVSLVFPQEPPGSEPGGNGSSASRNRLAADQLRGAKVLLVEDQMAVRKLVRKLLEVLGCVVTEVASGREALELWPDIQEEISLVLSDVVMPGGVSGWDLARDLHHRHPDLAILLTSGHTAELERHGLNDLPEVAFLQKPYGVDTLRDSLLELLEADRA